MKSERLRIPLRSPVESLCWAGDTLIDWVRGGVVFGLDGTITDPHRGWAYRFDVALQSPSGRYAVIYERLGTKALLLDRGKLVRELNRSYYQADAYEYPIALFEHADGRTLIAHCPEEYNRIDIDEAATGKRLTAAPDRNPTDFFHSRLAVSPRGSRLLSAGWIWHPVDAVSTWPVADALLDARTLDEPGPPDGFCGAEIGSAVFIDEDRILVSSNGGADDFGDADHAPFGPGRLGVFNLTSNAFEHVVKVGETVGTMLWLGDGRVVGFFKSPRVFDLQTGQVLERWPELATGEQSSSIIHHLEPLPPLACDPVRKRFAVACADRIEVVLL